jgi:hypothetical protein
MVDGYGCIATDKWSEHEWNQKTFWLKCETWEQEELDNQMEVKQQRLSTKSESQTWKGWSQQSLSEELICWGYNLQVTLGVGELGDRN